MKKIGILTLPLSSNYGGILQCFALVYTINSIGYQAEYINRRWNSKNSSLFYKFKRLLFRKLILYKFAKFIDRYIPKTSILSSQEQMLKLNDKGYAAFIVGSDQVWRLRYVLGAGYNFFLDFVTKKTIKKIAYAASFGIKGWDDPNPTVNIPVVKRLLSNFNRISVRENSAIDLCKSYFNVESQLVLDPTLLLSANDYIRIFKLKKRTKRYIATYILDESEQSNRIIKEYATKYKLSVISASSANKMINKLPCILQPVFKRNIVSWLNIIKNAEYVITDSFHGTVFSLIFHKKIICIENSHRGNTRIQSLINVVLGILPHSINNIYYLDEVDYLMVDNNIDQLRKESIRFIKSSLQ